MLLPSQLTRPLYLPLHSRVVLIATLFVDVATNLHQYVHNLLAYKLAIICCFKQEEFLVAAPKKQQLQPYDRFLKKFQYKNALDAVLKVVIVPS